jgi:hypothetical protein
MRSTQRDITAYAIFSASVLDAASGFGLAQPGNIPFTFTRTATGIYVYNFSPRLRALSGSISHQSGGVNNEATLDSFAAGSFRAIMGQSTGSLFNFNHSWTITARDGR